MKKNFSLKRVKLGGDKQNSVKPRIKGFDSISSEPTGLSFNSDTSDEREELRGTQLDDIIGSKVIAKCTKPLLLFDSPENVYNFCKAGKY